MDIKEIMDSHQQEKEGKDQEQSGTYSWTCSPSTCPAQWTKQSHEVKLSERQEKMGWKKAAEAEATSKKNYLQSLYKVVRDLMGRASNVTVPIKSNVAKHSSLNLNRIRRVEHFHEMLNQLNLCATYNLFDAKEIYVNTNIQMDNISQAKVWAAILSLKNNKVAGIDAIPPELLKYGHDAIVYQFVQLFNYTWNSSQVPADWTKATIVKVPKKGSLLECNN